MTPILISCCCACAEQAAMQKDTARPAFAMVLTLLETRPSMMRRSLLCSMTSKNSPTAYSFKREPLKKSPDCGHPTPLAKAKDVLTHSRPASRLDLFANSLHYCVTGTTDATRPPVKAAWHDGAGDD